MPRHSGLTAGAICRAGSKKDRRAILKRIADSVLSSLHYRSDIDGLRAIAIIPVVLFHLGFSAFSGGYVGVDVFFVISGFLITSIIYREMIEGNFSFAQFYERRIRRLFPALFFVIAVTTIAATVMLLPGDFRSFSQSIVAATVFGANLLFWKTSGYFDGPAEMKPLLHTWSLSVEEQFYIAFPVILLVLVRYASRHVRLVFVIAMLLSFAACLIAVQRHQEAAFYLPMFRAWELLLGALLAINAIPHPATHLQRHALSLTGLALIAYSVFALSADSTFPGANALYPSLGAAFIIYAGSGGHRSFVGAMLGWRPIVLIGLISYSLYLWHWPLIVFAKYYAIRELNLAEKLALLAISLVLAVLSWRYIERPFRGKSGLMPKPRLFAASAVVMTAAIAIGLSGHFSNGFPQRLPQGIVKIAGVASQPDPYRKNCQNLSVAKIERGEICTLGNTSNAAPDFLLWGDSHALALAPAFSNIAEQKSRAGWFVGKNACPPLLGVERYDSHHKCVPYNEAVTRFIQQHKEIRTVILAGRWGLHANGPRYGRESGKPAIISPQGMSGNRAALQQGLESTLQFLTQRDIKVIFITDVPEIGWGVPSALGRAAWFGHEAPTGPILAAYQVRQQPVNEILHALSANYPLRVVDVMPLFCPADRCRVEEGGMPLYRDDDHLSVQGARMASKLFMDLL